MEKKEDAQTRVIGYTRVSTRGQDDNGKSLEAQAEQIRQYCDGRKLSLVSIWKDIGSAAGPEAHLTREELQAAIKQAEAEGAPILVTRVDRLSREPAILPDLVRKRIQVISIEEGGRVGKRRLRLLIEEAQRSHRTIRTRTLKGVSAAKSRGRKLGNPESLRMYRRAGSLANRARADRKDQEIADFLETVLGWEAMTRQKLVDLLNARGPQNLISERLNKRRPWTVASLRKPLARAKEQLLFRAEMDADG